MRFASVAVMAAIGTIALRVAGLVMVTSCLDEGLPVEPLDSPTAQPLHEVSVDVGPSEYADTDPRALTDFDVVLAPVGSWVDDPDLGTVWVPDVDVVGRGFVPYLTSGRWAYQDDYVWMSDFAWGYIPFHYGRWVWSRGRGWAWVAGRTYADAWVIWRTGTDGYVGWAPRPPGWIWRADLAVAVTPAPVAPFVFCAAGDLFRADLAPWVVGGEPGKRIALHSEPYVKDTAPAPDGPLGQALLGGPPPSLLGIPPAGVHHAFGDPGLARARQYATPRTAVTLGAHAPEPHVVRVSPRRRLPGPAGAPGYSLRYGLAAAR